jgi:hypothetical protein
MTKTNEIQTLTADLNNNNEAKVLEAIGALNGPTIERIASWSGLTCNGALNVIKDLAAAGRVDIGKTPAGTRNHWQRPVTIPLPTPAQWDVINASMKAHKQAAEETEEEAIDQAAAEAEPEAVYAVLGGRSLAGHPVFTGNLASCVARLPAFATEPSRRSRPTKSARRSTASRVAPGSRPRRRRSRPPPPRQRASRSTRPPTRSAGPRETEPSRPSPARPATSAGPRPAQTAPRTAQRREPIWRIHASPAPA